MLIRSGCVPINSEKEIQKYLESHVNDLKILLSQLTGKKAELSNLNYNSNKNGTGLKRPDICGKYGDKTFIVEIQRYGLDNEHYTRTTVNYQKEFNPDIIIFIALDFYILQEEKLQKLLDNNVVYGFFYFNDCFSVDNAIGHEGNLNMFFHKWYIINNTEKTKLEQFDFRVADAIQHLQRIHNVNVVDINISHDSANHEWQWPLSGKIIYDKLNFVLLKDTRILRCELLNIKDPSFIRENSHIRIRKSGDSSYFNLYKQYRDHLREQEYCLDCDEFYSPFYPDMPPKIGFKFDL